MEDKYKKTHEFISSHWKDALRENKEGEYALPNPFVPPCIDGLFKCMFYWDTYYTNKGMILDDKLQYAKWNVDNIIYMLHKYGYVPNSNSYPGVKHNSQPPYLHFMVEDIYASTHDIKWLEQAYFAVKKEYEFWMNKRMTPIGLNRYYRHEKTDEECIEFYDYVATRLNIPKDAPREAKIKQGTGFNAACEGGLDFSPRYNLEGADLCEVDLNSILYAMEGNLAKWAKLFEPKLESYFLSQQSKRLALINKYLYNVKDGLYYDYNFIKKELEEHDLYFTGQFFPFIVGISKDQEACKYLLSKLEFKYGIASTNEFDNVIGYQAAYPYSWPYDNGICFWALTKMNMKDDIVRVGYKYLNLCANSYLKAGHLWETYSAIIDEVAQKKEYPNKEMLGWTAGIYEWIYFWLIENE